MKKVVVVGGGITGLATALKLHELKKERRIPLEITLLEASPRLGGVISSFKWQNNLLETGPDAIFTEKPAGLEFLKKIGLESEIIQTNPHCRKSYIVLGGELHPVPEGFYLLAPSKLAPLVTSRIFTPMGKLRMFLEPFIPRKKIQPNGRVYDESLDSFVRRRLGAEALDRMAQPMVAGIYSADPKELSLAATFPKFLEWERTHGSVVVGIAKRRSEMKMHQTRGPRYSLFVSLKSGLQGMITAAAAMLPPETIRTGAEIRSVSQDDATKRYRLIGMDFEMEADALCLALPAPKTSALVKNLSPELSNDLARIRYSSSLAVNLIFEKSALSHPVEGFGFVVPAIEKRAISGCTFASVKFLGRAIEGKIILRAYLGGEGSAQWYSKTDMEVVTQVRRELAQILNITAEPAAYFVHRYHGATPQYKVGHLDLLSSIEAKAKSVAGLALAGNAYRGIGIPDCIMSGEKAARELIDYVAGLN